MCAAVSAGKKVAPILGEKPPLYGIKLSFVLLILKYFLEDKLTNS